MNAASYAFIVIAGAIFIGYIVYQIIKHTKKR